MLKLEIRLLPAPTLEFGSGGEARDPRVGLSRFGPFSTRFGEGHRSRVQTAFVGPLAMIRRARTWFEQARGAICSEVSNKAKEPDYPGFEGGFRSELVLPKAWDAAVSEAALDRALSQ